MWNWIIVNRQWVFSGIGVSIIAGILWLLRKSIFGSHVSVAPIGSSCGLTSGSSDPKPKFSKTLWIASPTSLAETGSGIVLQLPGLLPISASRFTVSERWRLTFTNRFQLVDFEQAQPNLRLSKKLFCDSKMCSPLRVVPVWNSRDKKPYASLNNGSGAIHARKP